MLSAVRVGWRQGAPPHPRSRGTLRTSFHSLPHSCGAICQSSPTAKMINAPAISRAPERVTTVPIELLSFCPRARWSSLHRSLYLLLWLGILSTPHIHPICTHRLIVWFTLRCELPRTPSRRSFQNPPSTHSGEFLHLRTDTGRFDHAPWPVCLVVTDLHLSLPHTVPEFHRELRGFLGAPGRHNDAARVVRRGDPLRRGVP